MFRCALRVLPVAALALALAACSGETPQVPAANTPAPAAAPVVTDEAGLQAAAAKALSEQRFYAPAGDNALEHYVALRALRPDDGNLATALLELLPYAVIGTEQAVARQELTEARRLLALLERVDPQAPSLPRLRDSIAAAQASAEAAAAQALAEAGQAELARLAAVREAQAAAAPAAIPAAPAPAPAPAATAAASAPVIRDIPTAPAPSAAVATVPAVATTAAASPSPAAPTAIPRLLSAPNPRYPIMALRRKLEGEVTVQFTIQPDGSVAAARVVSADPAGVFDEAALVAASRWRFEAGPRTVASSRVVRFRLGEG